jgi:hypothetical protein
MHKLNQHRTGVALGSFIAFVHLVWSILVGVGSAKSLIDFKMALHGISMPYTLTDFSFGTAVALIVVTFVGGYLAGFIFAWIWNKVQK